ncbi:MAG: cytochrome c biogenesis protein CcsA [Capsulimonadales bacterium]|nr:cytochrome c biogenesis protein CcsA [Capsulimonadales bacterium]
MIGSGSVLVVTVALYLGGAVLFGANLLLRHPSLRRVGRVVTILAALTHMAAIGLRCAELQRAPFVTPAESLSLLAWITVLAYMAADLRGRLTAIGPFALGLAFLLVVLAALLPSATTLPGENASLLASNVISLHILATVGAIGVFALAFCCAALYLTAHHILKTKHGLVRMKPLPPLTVVESSAFTLIAVGFPLLTLGILAGLLRAWREGLPASWIWDPKALLSYAVWAVYAAYLIGRNLLNQPPIRTSYVLIVGLLLSLLLFLAPTTFHRFH